MGRFTYPRCSAGALRAPELRYNPLDKQLKYDPDTGEVQELYVNPYNKVDDISAYDDICYDRGVNKHQCDKEMIKRLNKISYGEMTKWGKLQDS